MALEQNARSPEDDHRKRIGGGSCLFQGATDGPRIVRIDRANVLDAERLQDAFHIELARGAVLERLAVERVALATGHGRRAVVEDADGARALVVNRRDKRRKARMRERGVADHSNDGTMLATRERKLEAVGHRHRCAHVNAGVHCGKRRQSAQRVAADVARHDGLAARELLEDEAMRAAGAQRRWATRNVCLSGRVRGLGETESGADEPDRELAIARQGAREARDIDPKRRDGIGQVARRLLDDVKRLNALSERAKRLLGKGPRAPELKDGRIGQPFQHMLGNRAGADDADLVAAPYDLVVRAGLGPFGERLDALELHLAARLRERGHHDPLRRVALVGSRLDLFSGPDLDRRLRMRDAHRRADEEGHIESLGKLERVARESERLGRISGVEHGNMRRAGVVVRILLVLRGVHARIVGCQHDKSSADAGIGGREQGVRRDVHADVLHGRKNASATGRCADAHFNGNLLVHAPLGVDAVLLRERLERLGRRGTRICDADARASFPGTLRNGLVSA